MSNYSQLSLEERCSIARLQEAGQSIRQIAAALDRQPSTIARELKRNSGNQVGYRPGYAQAQTDARRWSGGKLERDDTLRETILACLAEGWSPDGRLAREAGCKVISHETIYRFVYAQLKRTNDRRWRFYLPRAKYKRGWRIRAAWLQPTGRSSIHDRPADIGTRRQPGHWEADAMLFSLPGQAILVAHERHSRLTIALRQPSLKADPVATALIGMLQALPPTLRRSITFDNGTEFTRHQRIARQLGIDAFFCDPHAPWQKRRCRERHRQITTRPAAKDRSRRLVRRKHRGHTRELQQHARKCLGFLTPAEAFAPLHFQCESTQALFDGCGRLTAR